MRARHKQLTGGPISDNRKGISKNLEGKSDVVRKLKVFSPKFSTSTCIWQHVLVFKLMKTIPTIFKF